MNAFSNPADILIFAIALIISVVGHEIAHGFAAYKFGDETAKNFERLSINPAKHIDIIGTIIVPFVLYMSTGIVFGWAKPVPININTVIKNAGYKGAVIVSLAGIGYNIVLAFICFLVFYFKLLSTLLFVKFIFTLLTVNIILALFNLYPIPPLDGSRAMQYLAKSLKFHQIANLYNSFEKYALIVLIIIVITPIGKYIFKPIFWVLNFIYGIILQA